MSMKYRRLSPSGDYVFGIGEQGFITDAEAVGQAIKTRIQLFKNSFWRDLDDGTPMFQSILGSSGSPDNLLTVENILKDRIRRTTGVTSIISFSSSFDRDARVYLFQAWVQTDYSSTPILIQDSF